MFDLVSTSLFGTADSAMASVSTPEFLMCCAASIVLGAACAAIYIFLPQLLEEFRRHACAFAPHRANGHHPCKRQSGRWHRGYGRVQSRPLPQHSRICERHRQRVFGDGHWPGGPAGIY